LGRNKQAMGPAGRQFDMPALENKSLFKISVLFVKLKQTTPIIVIVIELNSRGEVNLKFKFYDVLLDWFIFVGTKQ